MRKEKIGIVITTMNRSVWSKSLLNSLQEVPDCSKIVMVNDGPCYDWVPEGPNVEYILNEKNLGIAKSKNIGLKKLLADSSIEYIFTIEDDVSIKDISVFKKMISDYKSTGIKFFTFPGSSYYSGVPLSRTPTTTIEYPNGVQIDFFPNIVAAFCFFHRSLLEIEIYNEDYRNCWFDVELPYRYSEAGLIPPFWYFPCVSGIDEYVELIEESIENSQAHGDQWDEDVRKYAEVFHKNNGKYVSQILKQDSVYLEDKLKGIYEKNSNRG